MSNLSELLPAGAGGKNVKFVASGTLPNGKPVILNANGTIEVVSVAAAISESIPAGSAAVFNPASTINITCAFDPNTANKFVVAYGDNGNSTYGTAIVGTISGTSLSFGSEYIFNAGQTQYTYCAFDPNTAGKFVITYNDGGNGDYGTAIVGTVSGTSLSFGSEAVFNSGETGYISVAFDPNTSGKFVVVYRDSGNSSYGTAIVGTVSGTTLSFGSESVFNSAVSLDVYGAFDPNTAGKFVVAYKDNTNSQYGTAVVGTVSGTSISFGSEYVFNSSAVEITTCAFDPNTAGKFVIAYKDHGNSQYGTAIVGTVSGSTLSFGSEYVFNSASTYRIFGCIFDPNTVGKFVVAYSDVGNSYYGTAIVGTVSGTTLSFGSESVFSAVATYRAFAVFDPNTAGKFVVAYEDNSNSGHGTAIVGQIAVPATTNLTSTNFIGISDSAISSGATGKATIKGGIKTGLSSLTPNAIYYLQTDGTITTASASPAVRIGKALSSTSINLEYNS